MTFCPDRVQAITFCFWHPGNVVGPSRLRDAGGSSSARHPENQGRPNGGVGEPPAARSSSLRSASLAAGRRPLCRADRPSREPGFVLVSPWELWLCFRPSAPAVSDLSSFGSGFCFDFKLALFGAFCGVVTSLGRHCPTPSPCPGWPAACAPSWDKIPILSSVASSETR
jgi:hypothetical protein